MNTKKIEDALDKLPPIKMLPTEYICNVHGLSHQFVIPVAWQTEMHVYSNIDHKRVTILRCACGEEINREGTK